MGETLPDRPRFRVLGPMEVARLDGARLPLGGRRVRQLLAVLLLHLNQTVSAARLVDSLWGEAATDGAFITLRTYVGQLRRLLADAGMDDCLVTRDGGYELVVDPADVDAELFERAVERGQEALALGDVDRARATLSSGLALWRGEVLADLGVPDFAEPAITRLLERRTDAWEAVVECDLTLGRHREVVATLQSLVESHPFRERFTAQLVVALYRSGRQAEALAAYQHTKQRLADELGIDPGPELVALERAVLQQDADLSGPPAVSEVEPVRRVASPPPLVDAVLAALGRRSMVGRAEQYRRLARAWATAADGGSAVVLVSGDAGIGKSRLVAELARRLTEEGAAVLVGRCEEEAPYQPLTAVLAGSPELTRLVSEQTGPARGLLEQLLPEAPQRAATVEDVPENERRLAVSRAFTWVMRAAAGRWPTLLLIEDADRLDDASAEAVRWLALHLPPRMMLVVCFRDPPGGHHPPLAVVLGDRNLAEVAERLDVGPLTEHEMHELVCDLTGTDPDPPYVARLLAETGGNPFFASEVVRAWGAQLPGDGRPAVPAGVRDVLRDRLRRLPTRTAEALAAAAVLGREPEIARLAGVLGLAEDDLFEALEPALAAGFLLEAGQSWAGAVAFPHDLMRAAVYAEVPPRRRERLHLDAAALLLSAAEVPGRDVVAAARHLRRAGGTADPLQAAHVSLRAAQVARGLLAWEDAVDHGEAALRLLHDLGAPREQARAQVEVATMRLKSGLDYRRAVTLLEDALSLEVSRGDLAAAGAVHSRLGAALSLHHSVMDIPRALEHFAAAARLLPEPDRVFHLHRGRAQAAMHGLRAEVLADASERADALAQRLSRPDLSVFGHWGRAWHAMNNGDAASAFGLLEAAWEVARDFGDAYLAWGPVNAAALFATEFRLDPATGRRWCRRGLGQPRFGSFRQPQAAIVDQLALAHLALGEMDPAREVVALLPPDAPARRVLRFRGGDWEGAEEDWTDALRRDEAAGDLLDALVNVRRLAEARAALGDEDGTEAVLEHGLEIAAGGPQVPSELWIRAELARQTAARAPRDAAEHVARCGEVSEDEWGGLRGHVAAARALVEASQERWASAQASQANAVAVFTRFRLPWHRAAAHRDWAGALLRAGRDQEAAEACRAAIAVYERLGAHRRWADHVPRPAATTRALHRHHATSAVNAASTPVGDSGRRRPR